MKLPYIFTAKGKVEVSQAHERVRSPNNGKAKRLIEAKRIIFRDRIEKLFMLVAGTLSAAGGSAYLLSHSDSGQEPPVVQTKMIDEKKEVPLETEDHSLLDRSIIRIGVKSSPQEKERIRDQIKSALTLVLADPEVAKAYAKSDVTEQLIVPHLLQALRELAHAYPDEFGHLDLEKESAHGDAYTIAIEDRGPDGRILGSKNYMMLRAELMHPENYPQLLMTLDHECRHLMFRGMNLHRREEEKQVYASSIKRMRQVAHAHKNRDGKDAEMGKSLDEVIQIHAKRLESWQRTE